MARANSENDMFISVSIVAATTLMFWDYILTFEGELELVWVEPFFFSRIPFLTGHRGDQKPGCLFSLFFVFAFDNSCKFAIAYWLIGTSKFVPYMIVTRLTCLTNQGVLQLVLTDGIVWFCPSLGGLLDPLTVVILSILGTRMLLNLRAEDKRAAEGIIYESGVRAGERSPGDRGTEAGSSGRRIASETSALALQSIRFAAGAAESQNQSISL
ncbi:hypothetical protein GYMLUDRAFT_245485 [Collybiopsis luxurians FD-317 M1]|uniref:DUF6533 domain-containing protein n=1 Tax=Collybiopsis luxurians FD-317 M1 TaxID=944289 RepID=A0A0D0C997_9AGAR|nr:hypothetical protein GYMLUDRAFT_245485 [Collybiopsis luxurians FD-317 M1]